MSEECRPVLLPLVARCSRIFLSSFLNTIVLVSHLTSSFPHKICEFVRVVCHSVFFGMRFYLVLT